MQLLSYINEPAPALAVRRLAQMAPQYEALFMRLAKETGIYIIGGTHPVFERGKIFNAAHLFTPNGASSGRRNPLDSTESGLTSSAAATGSPSTTQTSAILPFSSATTWSFPSWPG